MGAPIKRLMTEWIDEIDPNGEAFFFARLDKNNRPDVINMFLEGDAEVYILAFTDDQLSVVVVPDEGEVFESAPGPNSRATWDTIRNFMRVSPTQDTSLLRERAMAARNASLRNDPYHKWSFVQRRRDTSVLGRDFMGRNPVEALAIINPRDEGLFTRLMYGLMHKAEDATEYAKEEPLKAFLVAAAVVAGGYGIFRMATYPLPIFGGTLEMNGRRYRFTAADRLWMGRMVIGEAGEGGWDSPEQIEERKRAGAAVLWSVATRHMTKPAFSGWSFTRTMRAFSQPINPIWATPTSCSNGRGCCGSVTGACSPSRIRRRFEIRNKPWLALPAEVRGLVDAFVAGRVPNPIPGYNNFAARRAISSSSLSSSTLPPQTIGGNTFIRDPGSASGDVRVV
jgi:hypothetical protein